MGVKNYQELKIWQRGMDLATLIYKICEKLPTREKFGLISQLQRAAISIPANIAEGWSRNYTKEFIQFLRIALGSLAELETLLILCKKVGYLKKVAIEDEIRESIGKLRKMIYATIKSLNSRPQTTNSGL